MGFDGHGGSGNRYSSGIGPQAGRFCATRRRRQGRRGIVVFKVTFGAGASVPMEPEWNLYFLF
jgi:hypothetical protein